MYKYQQGGMTNNVNNSRADLYNALVAQGMLGEMSYEEFQTLPPDQLRQLMQGVKQHLQRGGRASAPTMGPSGQLIQNTGLGGANIEGSEPNNKQVNQGLINAGIQGGATLVGGIAGSMKNSERSAGSAENVAGDIVGGAAEGAASGAAFGPWGALIGAGVGGVMGGINNAQASDAERKLAAERQEASNVGSLGTQLNPMVAAYGIRTAENSLVNKMKNRADYPNYYQGVYSSKNKVNSGVSRAGFNDGHYFNDREQYQDGSNYDPSNWQQPIKPNVIYDKYTRTPWDRTINYSDYKRAEDAKAEQINQANLARRTTYNQDVMNYNQEMQDMSSLADMYNAFRKSQNMNVSTPQPNEFDYFRKTAGLRGNPLGARPAGEDGYRTYRDNYGMGGGYYGKKC